MYLLQLSRHGEARLEVNKTTVNFHFPSERDLLVVLDPADPETNAAFDACPVYAPSIDKNSTEPEPTRSNY